MSRYVSQPRAAPDGDWDDPLLPSFSVDEHVPVRTGLFDRHGNPIMRLPEPIGFHRPRR